MGKESIGVWLFAGVIGLTGLGVSGYLGDPNTLLEPFKSFSSSTEEPEKLQSASSKQDRTSAAEEGTAQVEKPAESAQVKKKQENEDIPSSVDVPQAPDNEVVDDTAEKEMPEPTVSREMSEEPTMSPEKAEAAPPAEPAAPAEATAPAETAAENEVAPENKVAPENIVPTFDILRVEPNGDMVIAGVAAKNADVEIVAGSKTLAVTKSNNRGEFVAIIDEPLKQGDYEIVLRATQDDGTVATSLETAIVSIPEKGSNDVLALVEAPGAPSRLITKSEPEKTMQVVEAPKQTESETENDVKTETEPNSDTAKSTETAKVVEPGETAEAAPAPVEESAPQQKTGELVRIEAVEIDGVKVFVAGATDPGARIRVYANEIVLGEDLANDEGRFLVEANRNLPVGDYVIRADRLSKNGIDVVSRAAVPFARSEGEKFAAVAVPQAPKLPAAPPVAAPLDERSDDKDNVKPSAPENIADDDTIDEEPSQMRAQTEQKPESAKQSDVAVAENAPESTTGTQNAAPKTGVADKEQTAAATAVDGITPTGNVNERLEPVDSSVIIRRGDTLWQISRRVYGRGIKYTTIYQANEDQIKDPDKIWPGQIFALPEKEDESEAIKY